MNIHLPLLLSLILLATTSTAQVSAPPNETEIEQAITRLREGLVNSFNQDDIDELLTFLDTNAVVTWQNGEVCEGRAAVKAYYERMMKGDHPVVSKVTAEPEILGRHLQGDWAVSWGNLNDRFVLTDGRELPLNSRFTTTIARRGDLWQVTAFHVSVNAFDNPILGLALKKVAWIVGGAALIVGIVVGLVASRILGRRKESGAA